jgi:hypothetical protein
MDKNEFTKMVDDVVAFKMDVADEFIADVIEPLEKIGSPESLIGKKYKDWTPLDRQLLSQVYGAGNETPLAKLIFNKSLEEVKELESEV